MTLLPPDPTARLRRLDAAERDAILAAIAAGSTIGADWVEKIRRFASLHGRNLGSEARRRFGRDAREHLAWMADLLVDAAGRGRRDGPPIDHALLNAALYCIDAAGSGTAGAAARAQCVALSRHLAEARAQPPTCRAMGEAFRYSSERLEREAASAARIVILCPSPFSLMALAVVDLCLRLGAPIEAIVLRELTLSRFAAEWRRDGARLLRKIWRKLILRSDENASQTDASLSRLCAARGLSRADLRDVARAHRVPVLSVAEFGEAAEELRARSPTIGIFTGGGMVARAVLDAFEHGVINVHMGPLPQYKGMDVVQAPILDGCFDSVGLTAHVMAPGLDAGPVLSRFMIDSDRYDDLGSLRNEIASIMPAMAVDAAMGLVAGRLKPQAQPAAGRQYYFLHRALQKIVNATLATRGAARGANAPWPVGEAFDAILRHAAASEPRRRHSPGSAK